MRLNNDQYISLVEGSRTPALAAVFEDVPPNRVVQLGRNRWSWIWNKADGVVIQPRVKDSPGTISSLVDPTPGVRSGIYRFVKAGLIILAFITLLGGIFLLGSQVKKGKI